MGEPRDFKKIFPERGVVRVRRTVLEFYTPCNFSAMANAIQTSNFVHGSAMQMRKLSVTAPYMNSYKQ